MNLEYGEIFEARGGSYHRALLSRMFMQAVQDAGVVPSHYVGIF